MSEHQTNHINSKAEKATFAGGCFWCMVSPFEELPGIISVVSGYTGGHTVNPTYEEVCSETTGHVEAVQITFNPEIFPYSKLLELFWQQIDPTDAGGQFHDRGTSYGTAIFTHSEEQKQQAEASKAACKKAADSLARLLPRSSRQQPSILPKNIIRATIVRTRATTNVTVRVPAERILSKPTGHIKKTN